MKEWEELQKFTAQLEQFYGRFNLHVELKEYTGIIEKNEKGLFSVKGMRRELMDYTAKSVFCSFILFCKKEELDPDDMNQLIRSLMQMKMLNIIMQALSSVLMLMALSVSKIMFGEPVKVSPPALLQNVILL